MVEKSIVKRMKKIETSQSFYCFRKTPFGPVAVLWSIYHGQPNILRILLSRPTASARQLLRISYPDSSSSSCAEIDAIADRIMAFLTGENIRFPLDNVRMDQCSGFQQKVLCAEHEIPRGCVSSYHRIALYLGNPNGARAVGSALANNPFPIIVPCHRVIRSDGAPGGYQGGLEMKRALLEKEQVFFNANGYIVKGDFFY